MWTPLRTLRSQGRESLDERDSRLLVDQPGIYIPGSGKPLALESLTIIAANQVRINFYSDKCAYENSSRQSRRGGPRGCGKGLEKSFCRRTPFSD